jgi:polar amino acid transport system substrate-binding protein
MRLPGKLGIVLLGFAIGWWFVTNRIADPEPQDTVADGITRITVHTPLWDEYVDNQWQGLYADTFNAIFVPLDIEIYLNVTPYENSLKRVQNKDGDVAMSFYHDEYPGVLYPQWPQELEEVFAVHLNTLAYTNEQDLLGKKLGWLHGYHFDLYLPKGVGFVEIRTENLGVQMLVNGEIDFFLDYQASVAKAAEENEINLASMQLSVVEDLTKFVYPVFRDDKRGQKLMQIYDRRMAELYADGTLDRLFRKYGAAGYPAPER